MQTKSLTLSDAIDILQRIQMFIDHELLLYIYDDYYSHFYWIGLRYANLDLARLLRTVKRERDGV